MITRKKQRKVHGEQKPITYLPDHITDEAVELGKKARKIACVLGKAERREPGVGVVHTYKAPAFRVEVKRKMRNVLVFRTDGDGDQLVFAAYLDRPPHGLGASAKVYCTETMQNMGYQIDAFHADAEREIAKHQGEGKSKPRRGNLSPTLIEGRPAEAAKTNEGYTVYFDKQEEDVPLAVHIKDFDRLKKKADRLETFLIEMEHNNLPEEERQPCCAERAAYIQEEIKEVKHDLEAMTI